MTAWRREGKYALIRGKQIIAKCYLDGRTLYVLTDGDERIGHYNDADEAKAVADERNWKEIVSEVSE